MSKTISAQEVKAHNSAEKGMYIIVDDTVYDVTNFVDEHPGGAKILKRVAGKDATKQFWKCKYHSNIQPGMVLRESGQKIWLETGADMMRFPDHNESVLKKYGEKLKIGTIGEKAKL